MHEALTEEAVLRTFPIYVYVIDVQFRTMPNNELGGVIGDAYRTDTHCLLMVDTRNQADKRAAQFWGKSTVWMQSDPSMHPSVSHCCCGIILPQG